jgi:hypothetical protein
MLGRKDYTQEELNAARAAVRKQLAAYRKLAKAVDTTDAKVASALADLESTLFTNMTLVLDRYFVHRLRVVSGKDGNPLNEVELLSDSLLLNGGVFRTNNVIKYVPGDAVLGLEPGDRISIDAKHFEALADAFLAEIEKKFR